MIHFLQETDRLLRHSPSAAVTFSLRQLLALVMLMGALYGAVMGSFGGFADGRVLHVLFAATKVPLLLLVTFGISLPSFFVLNTLLGLRSDFAQVLRALVATQAGLTIILASLSPFTAFWYASSSGYEAAVAFNTLMFGAASLTAQLMLNRFYQPLVTRNPRHRGLMRVWLLVYAFVGIQMAWVLRPFVGYPASPVQFFRDHDTLWDNAYVIVFRLFWELVTE